MISKLDFKRLAVGITLLAVVGAFLSFVLARREAKPGFHPPAEAEYAGCFSNLRKLHQAITLYRVDSGSLEVYGDMNKMGLPPGLTKYENVGLRLDPKDYPCKGIPDEEIHQGWPFGWAYWYWAGRSEGYAVGDRRSIWEASSKSHLGNTILISDHHHNNKGSLRSPMAELFGIYITLDGAAKTRIGKGLATYREERWYDPQGPKDK